MLKTQKLSHRYHKEEMIHFPDIQCAEGESLLILGQSGVGKTTLLHILAGLLKPNEGDVFLNEQSLYSLSKSSIDNFRGDNIGIVFQQAHFVGALTVLENILLTQKMGRGQEDKARVMSVLEQLQVEHKSNAYPRNLSQGEKQRVSIARAIINSPKLILADEPTSALDDKTCNESIKLLENQSKALGAALVIVTHDGRLKDFINNKIILE